jgi:hypothetical protein
MTTAKRPVPFHGDFALSNEKEAGIHFLQQC